MNTGTGTECWITEVTKMDRSKFENRGFADSRVYDIAYAAKRLHEAVCQLDNHNLAAFDAAYGGADGIFRFMADYSECEAGVRTVTAPTVK